MEFCKNSISLRDKIEAGADLVRTIISCYSNQYIDEFVTAGFWSGGQDPRRHPSIARVYTDKDKE